MLVFATTYSEHVTSDSLERATDNYIRHPNDISDHNDYVCGPMNRRGPVCSQC